MLEYWNYGMVCPMEMGACFVGKTTLTQELEIFHRSIIPDARQTLRPQGNLFILNELQKFRDV